MHAENRPLDFEKLRSRSARMSDKAYGLGWSSTLIGPAVAAATQHQQSESLKCQIVIASIAMHEEAFVQLRTSLDKEIHHWRKIFHDSKNKTWTYALILYVANVGCALGAAIAGVYNKAQIAGIFGALLAAVLALQRFFPFDHDTIWYRFAVGRCNILLNKTNSPLATMESLTVVWNDLNNLIAERAEKTGKLGSVGPS
jgi:hypothetical protein